ncbi:MAG: hypothetical protein A3I05_09035 [Deltaproteobacteria bacterium RIFCSPLOWO2_02_FULL_44_10]|nr:MAG: hypothetical protein A3C46_08580 [Deltaproteobacteria bacterium RIFCSPHIGHO2_02_FULL_44_16]OGQ45248.1 MAG: hypothetical protein A3I05_09035 [Deltaproteobacteria bacterium RIFCSPLOWO2_02_FULL_44_10]
MTSLPGFFETLRYKEGKIEYFKEHMKRLEGGIKPLEIEAKPADVEKEIRDQLQKKGLERELCRILLVVTKEKAEVLVEKYVPFPRELYVKGVTLTQTSHPDPSGSAHLKRYDRQGYNEAMQLAEQKGCVECLCHAQGRVLECSKANVIALYDGQIVIPSRKDFRLPGIMEQKVLERYKGKVMEGRIAWPLVPNMQLYITSSLKGLMPVKQVDEKILTINKTSSLYKLIPEFWPFS